MTNITDISEAAARNASEPGKFNFLDRVVGRNYPTESVEIYIDERGGYELAMLDKKIANETDGDKVNELDAERTKLVESLAVSKYIIHLEGISIENYDATVDDANEQYPVEYEESVNPITFAKTKTPLPSEERETYFRTHLWAKFIRSVEAPDGSIDDAIDATWVGVFMGHAPIMAQIRVQQAVETLRMTTNWMDAIQDEDFFPKS